MEQETSDELFRVLSKDVLKENLAKAGLYTLAYESLLHSIVHRPKKFLTMAGTVADEEYKAEVIALYPQSEFIASCLWLQKHGVLTAEDVKEIRAIRKHRTDIAHEPINVLLDTENQVDETKLMTIYQLLARIDQWWISEFEIPANPDFDGQEIDPGGLQSGSIPPSLTGRERKPTFSTLLPLTRFSFTSRKKFLKSMTKCFIAPNSNTLSRE